MLRLIQAHSATAWQEQCRYLPPALFVHASALHTLGLQLRHGDRKVIAHQVEFGPLVARSWVERRLTRRKRKDQPPMPCIDRVKAKHVAEKITISLGVLAVEDKMRSIDH